MVRRAHIFGAAGLPPVQHAGRDVSAGDAGELDAGAAEFVEHDVFHLVGFDQRRHECLPASIAAEPVPGVDQATDINGAGSAFAGADVTELRRIRVLQRFLHRALDRAPLLRRERDRLVFSAVQSAASGLRPGARHKQACRANDRHHEPAHSSLHVDQFRPAIVARRACSASVFHLKSLSAVLSRAMTWAADRLVVAPDTMSYIRTAAIGAVTGLAAFAITVIVMLTPVRAAEPDGVTRLIGLEMLRERMIEQRAIDAQPAGYQGVGYDVRVG